MPFAKPRLIELMGKDYPVRGLGKPRPEATNTHCRHGHERTEENTYINPSGGKVCLICRRSQIKEQKKRRRERANVHLESATSGEPDQITAEDRVPEGYWQRLSMRMTLPLPIIEAAYSALQSAKAGSLGGWEIALIERRICECASGDQGSL